MFYDACMLDLHARAIIRVICPKLDVQVCMCMFKSKTRLYVSFMQVDLVCACASKTVQP